MKIIRKNPFSFEVNAMEIDVTQEQLDEWAAGTLIQNAMPNLSADEREFIMTGILPDQWDEIMEDDSADWNAGS